MKPNLFIAGAPKCGTTSLHDYLVQHPGFDEGVHKEPHFFNEDLFDYRHATSQQDYLSFYSQKKSQADYLLDSSTNYVYSEVAAQKIVEFNAEAKFIVMLRNPIDLIRSWHQHLLFRQIETEPNLNVAWKLGPIRDRAPEFVKEFPYPGHVVYRNAGKLGTHLQRLMQAVDREKLFLIYLEDLKKNPKSVFESLEFFLGTNFDEHIKLESKNQAKRTRSQLLNRLLFYPGPATRLAKRIGKTIIPKSFLKRFDIFSLVGSTNVHKSMPDQLRMEMYEFFEEDIKLLSELTSRELSHWSPVKVKSN